MDISSGYYQGNNKPQGGLENNIPKRNMDIDPLIDYRFSNTCDTVIVCLGKEKYTVLIDNENQYYEIPDPVKNERIVIYYTKETISVHRANGVIYKIKTGSLEEPYLYGVLIWVMDEGLLVTHREKNRLYIIG